MLQRCFLILLFISPLSGFAQTDSLQQEPFKIRTVITYIYEKDFIYGNAPRYALDTNASVADKRNPPLDKNYNYLGINGSAAQSQIFGSDYSLYTVTGIKSYDLYILTPADIPSYRTNKRFSEINYNTGAFREQGISLLHTQNITKGWNAGIFFERMAVKDFMNFSDTYRSKFTFFTSYHSPDGRYSIFAGGLWNAIKNDVNGGLTNDSLFENTPVTNLGIKGLAYQLSNAYENTRKKTLYVSQYYDLGKAIRDTSGEVIGRNTILRLHHRIEADRRSFVYGDIDPDSTFYDNYFYGPVTYDSLHSDELRNRFALQKPAGAFGNSAFMRNWSQGVFVEVQNMKYGQRSDSAWTNISGGANVLWRNDSTSASFFGEASYVFRGMDETNYYINAELSGKEYVFGKLSVQVNAGSSSPYLFYRWYDGNNFRWVNDFKQIHYLTGRVSYLLSRYRLKAAYSRHQTENYVYLNLFALPQQYNETIGVNQLTLGKDFTFRRFHLDNIFIFQKSDNVIIPLPDFISENAIYYQNKLFKGNLKLSTGFRFNYSSSYYANAFMPATGEFYLQTEKKTGGYLRTDLFVNAEIKTAVIYIKMENIADGLYGQSYFLTPHYPMPGRVFKFGLRWRFFD